MKRLIVFVKNVCPGKIRFSRKKVTRAKVGGQGSLSNWVSDQPKMDVFLEICSLFFLVSSLKLKAL